MAPEQEGPDARPARRSRAEREQDLRATTDAIRQDLERLTEIEAEKQRLSAADPRIDELSDAAVAAADRVAQEARAERQLGRELG
jgi:hypothetical protein